MLSVALFLKKTFSTSKKICNFLIILRALSHKAYMNHDFNILNIHGPIMYKHTGADITHR